MSTQEYANPSEVVVIRVYDADPEGWTIDGMDAMGRYTEACPSGFADELATRANVARFRRDNGIPDTAVVVNVPRQPVPMKKFRFVVAVDSATEEEALQVMTERLDPDEDYGFPYTVRWTSAKEAADAQA